jgi:endonuclease/exonuclease/phosphatase (EEP) superfamily protein YafD
MMYWAEKFGPRRIVGGDFNSTPGTYWINTMSADYYDTWTEVTGSSAGGGTINGVRFDYLFWSKDSGASIQPTRVYVGSTSLSDHLPVIADYTIRP